MNTAWRRAVTVTAAASMLLVGCGKTVVTKPSAASDGPSVQQGFTVGLALPDTQTARYSSVDRPIIEKKIKNLCPRCSVLYQNAAGSQSTQQQQVATLVNAGVKVIILDAVDYKAIEPAVRAAHARGVKIVAYDRLAQGPIDAYTSFDNAQVGREQAEGLLAALGDKASTSSKIVMINGDKADPNAAQFKAGAHSVLDGKVTIADEYDTTGWLPSEAAKEMEGALAHLGTSGISAVYSANDGMAGGIIGALQSAHVYPVPPVSGQDAALDATQRIIAGTQAFTVYKPYTVEAATAAQMAIDEATGATLDVADTSVNSATNRGIPARLIDTTIMDTKNIRQTVIDGGLYTIAQICTPDLASACARLGLK